MAKHHKYSGFLISLLIIFSLYVFISESFPRLSFPLFVLLIILGLGFGIAGWIGGLVAHYKDPIRHHYHFKLFGAIIGISTTVMFFILLLFNESHPWVVVPIILALILLGIGLGVLGFIKGYMDHMKTHTPGKKKK